MKTKVSRSYDIIVYPYDEDDEEYSAFRISTEELSGKTIRIQLCFFASEEQSLLMGMCGNKIWFFDEENNRGLTMSLPVTSDDIYACFEEIDEYDDEQCSVLSETVNILYHDVFADKVHESQFPSVVSTVL